MGSSNLNSKLFRFHSAHPNVHSMPKEIVVPQIYLQLRPSCMCKQADFEEDTKGQLNSE